MPDTLEAAGRLAEGRGEVAGGVPSVREARLRVARSAVGGVASGRRARGTESTEPTPEPTMPGVHEFQSAVLLLWMALGACRACPKSHLSFFNF